MKQISFFLVSLFIYGACMASTVTLTTTVKKVTAVARPGIDYGGVRIEVNSPITGTSCGQSVLEKGFYFSSGTNAADMQIIHMFHAQALYAASQSLNITVHYDSNSSCQANLGVYFTQIAVDTP